MTHVEHVHCL